MPYSTSVQSCAIALRSAASERSSERRDIHQISPLVWLACRRTFFGRHPSGNEGRDAGRALVPRGRGERAGDHGSPITLENIAHMHGGYRAHPCPHSRSTTTPDDGNVKNCRSYHNCAFCQSGGRVRVSCCVAGRHQPCSRARHAIHQHRGKCGFVQHVDESCPTASVPPGRHASWPHHVSRNGRRAALGHVQRDELLARAPLRVGLVRGDAVRTGCRPSLRPAARQCGGGVRTI